MKNFKGLNNLKEQSSKKLANFQKGLFTNVSSKKAVKKGINSITVMYILIVSTLVINHIIKGFIYFINNYHLFI